MANKGVQFRSPGGTVWTVIKRWQRGWGGETWYKFQSEGGAIKNMLAQEFINWQKVEEEIEEKIE